MMNGKKGMTQEAIIYIVLAIATFLILLLVVQNYGKIISGSTDREICRSSVEVRTAYFSQNIAFRSLFKNEPQLKCRVDYACLSAGGGCQEGYEKTNIKESNDIKKEIAGKMYDCFNQMGRGQDNFVGANLLSQNICVICSQMRFDETARNKISRISDMGSYLSSTNVPLQNSTYSEAFSKSVLTTTVQEIDFLKEYAILYKLNSPSYWKNILTSGGAAGALGLKFGAVGTAFCGPLCGASGLVVGGIGGAIGGNALINYIEDIDDANEPVYSMHFVEYTADDIKKYCGEIMSLP